MVYILIPAYNEEKNIKKCLLYISQNIKRVKKPFKFVIVNDGSKDKTQEILESLKRRLPIKLLKHSNNRGVSEAFRTGLVYLAKESKKSDTIILMEGDGTSDPKLLPKIIGLLQRGDDVIICSRYQKNGGYRNFPLSRSFLSISANLILRLIFPIKGVRDYTIFYRGYKADVIKKLVKKHGRSFIKTKHYVANSEILIKLSGFTKKIKEIPFVYNYGNKKNPSAMKIIANTKAYFRFFEQQLKNNRD